MPPPALPDDTGTTTADQIVLDQATGDFDARGHAVTTRLPEQKTGASSSAMLDKSAPTQGSADPVSLRQPQPSAALRRECRRMAGIQPDSGGPASISTATARPWSPTGKVVSQFQDQAKPTATVVKAPHMVYTDADRLAHYTGGVDFLAPHLTVKSEALDAWLNAENFRVPTPA